MSDVVMNKIVQNIKRKKQIRVIKNNVSVKDTSLQLSPSAKLKMAGQVGRQNMI